MIGGKVRRRRSKSPKKTKSPKSKARRKSRRKSRSKSPKKGGCGGCTTGGKSHRRRL